MKMSVESRRRGRIGVPLGLLAVAVAVVAAAMLYALLSPRPHDDHDLPVDFRRFTENPGWWSYRDLNADLRACDDANCLSDVGLGHLEFVKLSSLSQAGNPYALRISMRIIQLDDASGRREPGNLDCCSRYARLNPTGFLDMAKRAGLESRPAIAASHPAVTAANVARVEQDLAQRRQAILTVERADLRRIRDVYATAMAGEIERLRSGPPPAG